LAGDVKRQTSRRGLVRAGRIFLSDAVFKYGVPKTTLHRWVRESRSCDALVDDVSNQVHVDESLLIALLRRKGITLAR
jgi:hypothetical protein